MSALREDVFRFDPVARRWLHNGEPTFALTTKPPRRGRGLWSVVRGRQVRPPDHYATQIRRALGIGRNAQALFLEVLDPDGRVAGWSVVRPALPVVSGG